MAMHAVVTRVAISDREGAEGFLKDQVVPAVSQAPGFVAGYWVNLGGRGTSIVVFESEQAASGAAEQVRGNAPETGAVTIESVDVGEVVASA
jgi:hypothetical protein